MQRLGWLIIILLAAFTADADPWVGNPPEPRKTEPKVLHVVLSKDAESEPTNKFFSDTAKIDAFWKSNGLKAGDKIRAIWIAEDVGIAAPKNSKITEASATAYKPDDDGAFALSRPEGGWPVGKYRLEIFIDQKLAETLRFTIDKGVTIEVGHDAN